MRAGVDASVSTPWGPDDLVTIIRRVSDGEYLIRVYSRRGESEYELRADLK